jgi:citrate synthase
MQDDKLYVTAKEAAAALGVSVATLYTYVSRGHVRSQDIGGSRSRRYWKVDIERLRIKRGTVDDVDPISSRDPGPTSAAETKITLLTEQGLYYRGCNVAELAQTETFESVAALLWEADRAAIFTKSLPMTPRKYARIKSSLSDQTVMEQVVALFPMIERANPRSYDLSKAGFARTGADLSRWFAAILVGADRPSDAPAHEFVARSLKAPKGFADVIRRLLIVAADHEFDPTTYAVRAAANVGLTPYYTVMTGIIVSRGQRFQSGRIEATARILEEIVSKADPRDCIVGKFRNGEPLTGFQSPVHRKMDPRAAIVMDALKKQFGDDIELKRLQRAADTAAEISGALMGFILPAIFVGRKLGFKGQELAVASLGRAAGWMAHAMEQYHDHSALRPRAKYMGPLPA